MTQSSILRQKKVITPKQTIIDERRENNSRVEPSPSELIKQQLLSWKGVTIHEHNFVTMIFYVNGMEMGHLHGDSIADLQFPEKVSKKLVRDGYVSPHHIIPKSGWVSHEINDAKDVKAVIELLRFQYNRLVQSE